MTIAEQVSGAIVDVLKSSPDPHSNETTSDAFVACVISAVIISFARVGIDATDLYVHKAATAATHAIRDVCTEIRANQAAKN